jgi:cobyrinic acid a,c-diamide synthase
VLNHVAGSRHERIVRDSITGHCGIPVLGAVPKLRRQIFTERHMGLVPTYEHQWAQEAVGAIADLAEKYVDMSAISQLICFHCKEHPAEYVLHAKAAAARPDPLPLFPPGVDRPRIGVIRDSAFQFYYPENLDALVQAGAELVVTSPLFEENLPEVDALYIGGGFPETHADRLAKNVTYREQLRQLAEAGLPIYAECGGLMYLGQALVLEEGTFPMAGVLPVSFGFSKRPQGHGYTLVQVDQANPFYAIGQTLRGHEFHYSSVLEGLENCRPTAFKMERGNGLIPGRDALCRNNVLATYTHIHALGTPQWAPALVAKAREYRQTRLKADG